MYDVQERMSCNYKLIKMFRLNKGQYFIKTHTGSGYTFIM